MSLAYILLVSWLAQLVGYQTVVREIEGSIPGRISTQGLKINWEESALKAALVFSDKDIKP